MVLVIPDSLVCRQRTTRGRFTTDIHGRVSKDLPQIRGRKAQTSIGYASTPVGIDSRALLQVGFHIFHYNAFFRDHLVVFR